MPESGFYSAVEARRTVRDFLPEPVPQEVLNRCLDAARLAPSSSNLQPWEFVVIRDPKARQAANAACLDQMPAKTAPLLIALVTHRETWRRNRDEIVRVFEGRGPLRPSQASYYKKIIPLIYTTGPLGILGPLKRVFSRVGSLFKPTPNLMSQADIRVMAHKSTALAAATFMLALRAEGYDSCPMEGFDPWRAKALLGLPRGAEVNMFLAIGKRSESGVWWDRVLMPRDWVVREL
ncbi:nitroreductase family protein [Geothrix sp. PMB-07]|uniref:nitroreductase family protein n=1 Tax=Geothrix sp. PMB-07 TaxID=3068640 RepID=UPI0027426C87|nr:nitroreductase family protein [Geothrix sp. PMB-07]WLT32513.1 nitroreductase family protein [Geothrix sp. PMB-07]